MISQDQIIKQVGAINAFKRFDLSFEALGPYKGNYYQNGRYLLLGGKRGHVFAMDWITKDLLCEFNVRESVHAVCWLHIPTMFVTAQKDYVHMYDKSGMELNVFKNMYRVTHLEFLRYHFLLASISSEAYLNWTDVTVGNEVANFHSKLPIISLAQNKKNSLLYCTHPNGTLSMWSPNSKKPCLTMLCHKGAVRGAAVSSDGNYFATTGVDQCVNIWDLRNNFKCLKEHRLNTMPEHIDFSQKDFLAVSTGKTINIYKNALKPSEGVKPYLKHNVDSTISGLYFCNYEDIIGVCHQKGFSSLLVPGSGEPDFDSHEANPFMTKSQEKEMEVKMLLDKLPHEMISLHSM